MTASETYLAGWRYDFGVKFIANAIRRQTSDAERYDRLHVGLKYAGVDMGEAVPDHGMIRPSRRADLVDALMKLEPDVLGRFDEDDVRWVLGDHNLWPDRIRADADKAKCQ